MQVVKITGLLPQSISSMMKPTWIRRWPVPCLPSGVGGGLSDAGLMSWRRGGNESTMCVVKPFQVAIFFLKKLPRKHMRPCGSFWSHEQRHKSNKTGVSSENVGSGGKRGKRQQERSPQDLSREQAGTSSRATALTRRSPPFALRFAA